MPNRSGGQFLRLTTPSPCAPDHRRFTLSLYLESLVRAPTSRRALADVRTTCFFIGYPRSGHSLVGSLLDAHPNACIAHEANVLEYVARRFSRQQIFHILYKNAQRFAEQGREWTGYTYEVPGFTRAPKTKILVLGDKKGGTTTQLLGRDFSLAEKFQRKMGPDTRFLHVTRNPFDNIATICRRRDHKQAKQKVIDFYFDLCDTIQRFRQQYGEQVLDLRSEDLVQAPEKTLTKLCQFLDLPPNPEWIQACRSILFQEPHQSRTQCEWPPSSIRQVQSRMAHYPFLQPYQEQPFHKEVTANSASYPNPPYSTQSPNHPIDKPPPHS